MKKALNALYGIKVKTNTYEHKHTPLKSHKHKESKKRIEICLNCTKPASECKGDCFGRSC